MTVCAGGEQTDKLTFSPLAVQSLIPSKLLELSDIEEVAPRKLPYF